MVSVGKEYRQTLFSSQYVKNGLAVSGVDNVMGQSRKLI